MLRRSTDRFFRQSNVIRIIGIIAIIAGEFIPSYPMDIMGIKLQSNLIQVAGFVSIFSPMLREILLRRSGRSSNHD